MGAPSDFYEKLERETPVLATWTGEMVNNTNIIIMIDEFSCEHINLIFFYHFHDSILNYIEVFLQHTPFAKSSIVAVNYYYVMLKYLLRWHILSTLKTMSK